MDNLLVDPRHPPPIQTDPLPAYGLAPMTGGSRCQRRTDRPNASDSTPHDSPPRILAAEAELFGFDYSKAEGMAKSVTVRFMEAVNAGAILAPGEAGMMVYPLGPRQLIVAVRESQILSGRDARRPDRWPPAGSMPTRSHGRETPRSTPVRTGCSS
jgi:hypothetical protein